MNRGAGRAPIFRTQRDAADFVELLGDSVRRTGASVIAYSLMTNHFHLLLCSGEGGLSETMHSLAARYVRRFNDRVGRDGPLFRSRFVSKPVESWEYRVTAARYIHRNPLDLRRPEPLSEFRWSSYGAYLGRREVPPWLDPRPVLDVFGGDLSAYQRSVECEAGRFGASPETLLGLLEVTAGELADLDAVRRRVIVRATGIALVDRVPPRHRDRLVQLLGYTTAKSLRAAQQRVAPTLAGDPDVAYLIDRLRTASAGAWHR